MAKTKSLLNVAITVRRATERMIEIAEVGPHNQHPSPLYIFTRTNSREHVKHLESPGVIVGLEHPQDLCKVRSSVSPL